MGPESSICSLWHVTFRAQRKRNTQLTFCSLRWRDKDMVSLGPGNGLGQLFGLTILTAFYLQTCRALFDEEPNKLPPPASHGEDVASIPVKAALWLSLGCCHQSNITLNLLEETTVVWCISKILTKNYCDLQVFSKSLLFSLITCEKKYPISSQKKLKFHWFSLASCDA